jgi:pimeloyl-ACP methyl ester carboxylesterase
VLPAHMVPSAVVVLSALPRTPNGKVDRRSLPAPTAQDLASVSSRTAPRSDLEARLLALWEEVLDLQGIGVTDDFFSLGVDSLRAARLFARVRKELGVELPLAPVFAAPTVERFAELVRGNVSERRYRALVPIQPKGTRPPFFAVHGGAGTVLLYSELSRRLGDDQPFYGLQAVGLYGGNAPQTSVTQMAASYIKELRTVQPHGPYHLGGYCYGALVAFEMARLLRADGEQVAALVTFNGPAPAYLRRHRAVFDDEGAVFDEDGKPRERARPVRIAWRDELRGPGGVRRAGRRALASGRHRIRRAMLPRVRQAQLRWCTTLDRPLPESLREASWFQLLAARAQDRYDPSPVDVPVVVFRAPGLYAEPALGWDVMTTGDVQALEVPGEGQTVPRRSMREPYVAFIADRLTRVLAGQTD